MEIPHPSCAPAELVPQHFDLPQWRRKLIPTKEINSEPGENTEHTQRPHLPFFSTKHNCLSKQFPAASEPPGLHHQLQKWKFPSEHWLGYVCIKALVNTCITGVFPGLVPCWKL